MNHAAPYHYAKKLTFRHIAPVTDENILIAFGRDLFVQSVGDARSFHRTYGRYGQRFPLWVAACAARNPDFACFLTEDETPIGMAVVGADRREPHIGHIHHLYMRGTHRGQGFGGLLDDHARVTLRDAGFARARLNVSELNTRAVRFYEAQGWTEYCASRDGLQFFETAL